MMHRKIAKIMLLGSYPFTQPDVDRFLDIVYNEVKLNEDKQKCLDYLPNMAYQHETTLTAMINALKRWSFDKWNNPASS